MSSFLRNHTRQPRIYIDLPTGGKFYKDNVFQDNQFVHIPVFGMSTMDEISLKTPDALFSGKATADVIKSCIPTVNDPYQIVRLDLEYILLAIKIATYGDILEINATCPKCAESTKVDADLSKILANFENSKIENEFILNNLTFKLQPITYREVTESGIESYALEKKIANAKKDLQLDQNYDEYLNKFLQELLLLNNQAMVKYISNISNNEDEETDKTEIQEFIKNNDKKVAEMVSEKVNELVRDWSIPDLHVDCTNEECKNQFVTGIVLDYSNFFGDLSYTSRNLS
jgi:hypothetical protein